MKPPKEKNADICPYAHVAEMLARRYGTRDPFVIAENLGITVLRVDSLSRLKGMYYVIKRNRFIILNRKNAHEIDRIVCAHELGHDRLHRVEAKEIPFREFSLYRVTSRQEYEANLFAASLLLSDSEMTEYLRDGLDAMQIAAKTALDVNLVAMKADILIRRGYPLQPQDIRSDFLK